MLNTLILSPPPLSPQSCNEVSESMDVSPHYIRGFGGIFHIKQIVIEVPAVQYLPSQVPPHERMMPRCSEW